MLEKRVDDMEGRFVKIVAGKGNQHEAKKEGVS